MHGSGKLSWGRGLCTMCEQCRGTSSLSHPITGWTLTRLTDAGQSSFCSLAATVSHVARERWLEVFWILLIGSRHRNAHWDLWNGTKRFMFKTYSSSSSLVITSRWFATSRLASPASVRLVYSRSRFAGVSHSCNFRNNLKAKLANVRIMLKLIARLCHQLVIASCAKPSKGSGMMHVRIYDKQCVLQAWKKF